MKRYLAMILTVCSLSLLSISTILPTYAAAFDPFPVCTTSGAGADSALCQENPKGESNPLTGPNGLFFGVAKIMAFVSGLTAVILIIVAGLKFITAGGDAAKIKSARGTIVDVIVGLVIVALASTIITFVLGRL